MSNPIQIENGVSIIMPTFQRPQDLPRALDSLLKQEGVKLPIEIIVADNDPARTAEPVIKKYIAKSDTKIIYVSVPNPGVSNVRNGAIAVAKGRYVAWLDDDQEAAPNWLAELLSTAQRCNAGLVFCPSPPVMEVSTKLDNQYIKFFERKAPPQDGVIEDFYGCGNSLMDLRKTMLPTPVFCTKANESGGEDDMLFDHIQRHGIVTAWTSKTFVYEHVPVKRASPAYVRRRAFAWGQGPCELAYDQKDLVAILKWMFIGAAQIAIYSPIMAVTFITKHNSYTHWLNKTFQGLGKFFWHKGLRPKLYGQIVREDKAPVNDHLSKKPVQS